MILYCDSNGNKYDVDKNTTGDETLIPIEVNDEDNPFDGWSKAKICCYRCQVVDGRICMMTPRVDSRLIDYMDTLGKQNEALQNIVSENDAAIIELADMVAGMEVQNG